MQGLPKKDYTFALANRREELPIPIPKDSDNKVIRVTGTFGQAHKEIVTIMNKHCEILHMDEDLNAITTKHAQIKHRSGKSIRDRITFGHLVTLLVRSTCCRLFQVWTLQSQQMATSLYKRSATKQNYKIRDLNNCSSKGVIYMVTCTCHRDYVGKTKRQKSILEHIGDIIHERDPPLARHIRQKHEGNTQDGKFHAIELIRKLLQKERKQTGGTK